MRCFFITPLKPPDHPTPSGDRTIARLFIKALEGLGHTIVPAWSLRTFSRQPRSSEEMADLQNEADHEIKRLVTLEQASRQPPPGFVFSYHVYYKAPDLVGPALARHCGIPYIIAEGSISPKRRDGRFAHGERLAEEAIASADLLLCPTAQDRRALDRFRPESQTIFDLKPFLDLDDWNTGLGKGRGRVPRLLAVGMLREGDKMASYAMLAGALANLRDISWHLNIVGDGPQRAAIEALFGDLPGRVTFHGLIEDRKTLSRFYADADLFVWPGINEAFGMAYLEAQAHGTPCLAGRYGGIEDVIAHDETGVLVENCDAPRFASALRNLLADRERLLGMAHAARAFIQEKRSLPAATAQLAAALASIGIHSDATAGAKVR